MITRLPEAVEELLSIAGAALPDMQVLDGPTLGELMDEALVIGLAEEAGSPGYESAVERQEGYGRPRYVEVATVRCMFTATSNSQTVAQLRHRCADVVDALDTALRAVTDVDGVWDRVQVGTRWSWTPFVHEGGATVNVFFEVVGTSLL